MRQFVDVKSTENFFEQINSKRRKYVRTTVVKNNVNETYIKKKNIFNISTFWVMTRQNEKIRLRGTCK